MNATRTTHKTYEFAHPFNLVGYAQGFLPGRYSIEVEEEEELSSGHGCLDYRLVKARLFFTPKSGAPIEIGSCGIDPNDFDRAVLQDGKGCFGQDNAKESIFNILCFDGVAIERAENEGMPTK